MNPSTINTFYSSGNLIITGEYFVLIGALALAVPLIYGQHMEVQSIKNGHNTLQWNAYEQGKPWFNAYFNCENINIISASDLNRAQRLQESLKAALKLKPGLFENNKSYRFTCDIDFNTDWGWGSSSTFILNLANWAGVDPFELNKLISPGSGYDIATSDSSYPIFYQLLQHGDCNEHLQ